MGSSRDHRSGSAGASPALESTREEPAARGPVQDSQFQAQLAEMSPRAVQAAADGSGGVGPANTKKGFVWALATNQTGSLPAESPEDAWNYARSESNSTGASPPTQIIDKGSSPSATMNRAEAAKVAMLARYGDAKVGAAEAIHFHDAEGAWYSDAAHAARAHGVIEGFADNSFRPSEPIAAEHAGDLAAKAAEAPTGTLSPSKQVLKLPVDLRSRAITAGPGAPGVQATYDADEELTPDDTVKVPAKHLVFEQLAHEVVYKDKAWLLGDEGAAYRNMLLSAGYSINPQVLGGPDGLYAQLFVPNPKTSRPATRPVLVFRGTELFKDFLTDTTGADLEVSIGQSQYQQAVDERLVEILEAAGKADVTGHSLGGALAQHAAAEHSRLVAEVVTFQAPGIGRDKAEKSGVDPEDVTHYVAAGDPVHRAGGAHVDGRFVEVDSEDGLIGMEGVDHTKKLFETEQFGETFESLGLEGKEGSQRTLRELEQDPARESLGQGEEVLRLLFGGHVKEAARILEEQDWPALMEASLVIVGGAVHILVERSKGIATVLYEGKEAVISLVKAELAVLRAASDLLVQGAELMEQGAQSHGSVLLLDH